MPQENKNEKEEEKFDREHGKSKEVVRFPVDENLRLRGLQNSPSRSANELIFPHELNNFLRTQINNLTAENGALRRSLDEKEREIHRMQDMSSSGSFCGSVFAGVGRASDLAASKIVELSKRVRVLTAELEGERARRRKMVVGMEQSDCSVEGERDGGVGKRGSAKDRKRDPGAKKSGESQESEDTVEKREDELKALREKLSVANTKLAEWRNQCQCLKQELKLADKILACEIGDATTVEAAKASMSSQSPPSGGSGSWRGRAQQLTLLRHKVSELQEKLKKVERGSGCKDGEAGADDSEGSRRDREKRAAEAERLEASMVEAEKRAEEWRRKAEVGRARVAALRAEADALRIRMSTILAKAEHDDQLISSLNECLKNKESLLHEKESEMKAMIEKMKKEKEDIMEELTKEKTKVSHMKDALSDKSQMLESLEQKLKELKSTSDSREDKVPFSQNTSTLCHPTPSAQELQALSQATEAERLRLIELVTVLNRRLEEERNQTDKASKALRMERHKNARLETKVARMELEFTSGRNKAYNRFSFGNNSCSNEIQVIPDEIKYRLEILEEEKLVLESRIECLKQEKEDDLRKYLSMLRETREVFQFKIEQMENSQGNMNTRRNNSSHSAH